MLPRGEVYSHPLRPDVAVRIQAPTAPEPVAEWEMLPDDHSQ
jgi:hypothetical protein